MHQVAAELHVDIDEVSQWPKQKFERWVAFFHEQEARRSARGKRR